MIKVETEFKFDIGEEVVYIKDGEILFCKINQAMLRYIKNKYCTDYTNEYISDDGVLLKEEYIMKLEDFNKVIKK